MKIDFKRHIGVILILIGVVLTMDNTHDYNGMIERISNYTQRYWPIMVLLVGVYLLSNPKKNKK